MIFDSSLAIPWMTYEGTEAGDLTEYRQTFSRAVSLLTYISKLYGLTIPVPDIRVLEHPDPGAEANPDGWVLISTGLISYARDAYDQLSSFDPDQFPKSKMEFYSTMMILFCVAHEFFHIARGHLAAPLNKACNSQSCEYDADGMAVTAMYRWLLDQEIKYNIKMTGHPSLKTLSLIKIKRWVVDAVFWPIRGLIGSAIASPDIYSEHPCLHVRLVAVVRKLSFVDNVSTENGKFVEMPGVERDFKVLVNKLVDLDFLWIKFHGIQAEESTLLQFFNGEMCDDFLFPLHRQWEEISGYIDQLSCLENIGSQPK